MILIDCIKKIDRGVMMELKNLDTFIQVAELCSFTKAAEKIGCSQSTVSFQIKQLETSLGIQLFERINHTVSLTSKGREVLQYAHSINKLTHELEKQINEEEDVSGHIRIAMADSLCNWLLKSNFEAFRIQHEKITLKIIAASTEEMFRLLNQNEVDLVYTLDNHFYNRDYVIACEEKLGTHFVVSSKSPLGERKNIPIAEIVEHPFILTEKGMSYRRLMDEKLASMSLEINPVLEVGNADLICSLVEQGMGISFLPDFVTQKAVEEGRLKYLDTENFEIDIWKQLLYHKDKWVTDSMKYVIEFLAEKNVDSK